MKFYYLLLLFVIFGPLTSCSDKGIGHLPVPEIVLNQTRSLVIFVRDNTEHFVFSFVKMFKTIKSPQANLYQQTVLIHMRTHIDELCPYLGNSCWCGFFDESDSFLYNQSSEVFAFLSICSTDPIWLDYKEKVMTAHFKQFDRLNPNTTINFKIHEKYQAEMLRFCNHTQPNNSRDIGRSNRTATIEEHYKHLGLYKHEKKLCDDNFKWCWCGPVNSLEEYHGLSIQDKKRLEPRVLIDCRPYEERPFEKRNCIPDLKHIPFHRRFLGLRADRFPCGKSEIYSM